MISIITFNRISMLGILMLSILSHLLTSRRFTAICSSLSFLKEPCIAVKAHVKSSWLSLTTLFFLAGMLPLAVTDYASCLSGFWLLRFVSGCYKFCLLPLAVTDNTSCLGHSLCLLPLVQFMFLYCSCLLVL